jgi:hypothetical protein
VRSGERRFNPGWPAANNNDSFVHVHLAGSIMHCRYSTRLAD